MPAKTTISEKSIKKNDDDSFTAFWYVNRKTRKKKFSTFKLAESFLIKKRLEREEKAIYGERCEDKSNNVLISMLIKNYRKEVKKSQKTLKNDDIIIPRWEQWFKRTGIAVVSDLNKKKIKKYENHRLFDDNVKPRTVNIDIKTLNAILNHAWKFDEIKYNPIAKYDYQPDKNPLERYLTMDEIDELLVAAEIFGEYPLIYAYLTLGMRSEELCYLQYLDIKDNEIFLRPKTIWTIDKDNKKIKRPWAPKWYKSRNISFDEDYANDDYLKELLNAKKNSASYCFPNPSYDIETPRDRYTVYNKFQRILRASKIKNKKDINVHTLRHTHVTYMVTRIGKDKNISLRTIMDNVGINNYDTLLGYTKTVKKLAKNLPDPTRFPWQKN